jgi:hypothetical protein
MDACDIRKKLSDACKKAYAKQHIQSSGLYLGISVFLLLVLCGILAYCLYKIITVLMKWFKKKKSLNDLKKQKLGGVSMASRKYDNEVYPDTTNKANDAGDGNDDYSVMTQSIQATVDGYKAYNEQLLATYQKRSDTPQDIIDRQALFDRSQDNY